MRLSSTYIKNVFCLEGEWGKDLRDRSSIKAALNFMQANFDIKYIYKRCSNRENLEYYVKRWKNKKYQSYSICYLAFHGEERSEEHTSELQSHSFISYAVFCLKKEKHNHNDHTRAQHCPTRTFPDTQRRD